MFDRIQFQAQPLSAQFQPKQPQPQPQPQPQFIPNQPLQQRPQSQFMPNQQFQPNPQFQSNPQFNRLQPQSQSQFTQPLKSFQQFQNVPQSLNNFQQQTLSSFQQQPIPPFQQQPLSSFQQQSVPPPNLMQTFSQFTPNSKLINDLATTSIKVAERIMNNKPVTPNFQNLDSNTNKPFSTPKQLPQLTLKEVSQLKAPARFCPFKTSVKCDPQFPYRQIDGSCNNLDNLWWGQAEMPFKRFIDADYSDRKLFIYSFLFISF